jgi:hypothetical protein
LRPRKPDSKTRFRRRPFGVYAIAALLVLDAVAIALGASNPELSRTLGFHVRFGERVDWPLVEYVVAGLIVVVALGLLLLRRWAWVATMVLIGAGLATGIWLYFNGTERYVNMLLNVFVVFYLNQRAVQAAFETPHRGVH